MASTSSSTKTLDAPVAPPADSSWRLLIMFAIALFGVAVSIYLTAGYLRVTQIACTDAGCDIVRQWHDRHLPTATMPLVGLLYFIGLTVLTIRLGFVAPDRGRRLATLAMALGAAGTVAVAGLTSIEAFYLHSFCFWCVMVAISTVLFFAFSVSEWRAWRRKSPRYNLDFEPFLKWGAAPLALVFLLASGMEPHSATTPADLAATGANVDPTTAQNALIRPDSHTFGPKNARVTIVEFADPGCPACARQMPIMEALLKRFPKDVRLVYRNFPLRSHPNSPRAAEAIEAAAAQGKLVPMRDLLFKNYEAETEPDLDRYAQQVGLNMELFKRDMATHKYQAKVQRDRADGDLLGVHSTPTLIVNGQQRLGPTSLEVLDGIVRSGLPSPPKPAAK